METTEPSTRSSSARNLIDPSRPVRANVNRPSHERSALLTTRKHVHEEFFPVSAESLFAFLVTPSAIRSWWGAARVIVLAEEGGTWAAAWGDEEDEPDYVTVATIRVFDAPNRLVLDDYRYHSKAGKFPFEANFETEFVVEPQPTGSVLRVTQDGFPAESAADDFYASCKTGWMETFAGIRRTLESRREGQGA